MANPRPRSLGAWACHPFVAGMSRRYSVTSCTARPTLGKRRGILDGYQAVSLSAWIYQGDVLVLIRKLKGRQCQTPQRRMWQSSLVEFGILLVPGLIARSPLYKKLNGFRDILLVLRRKEFCLMQNSIAYFQRLLEISQGFIGKDSQRAGKSNLCQCPPGAPRSEGPSVPRGTGPRNPVLGSR